MKTCLIASLLLLAPFAAAAEEDPVAKEMARYDDAVAKLRKTFDDAAGRERAKTVPALAAVAKKALGKGDMPGAVKAWKAVLRLERANADARQFFTSVNQLDQVLAELDKEDASGSDLLGDPVAGGGEAKAGKPWEGTATVDARSSVDLGAIPKGTTITLQYQDGTWTFRQGVQPPHSPDSPDAPQPYHVVLAAADGEPAAEVGTGSAQKPFTWTAERDYPSLRLRMARFGRDPAGVVHYKVRIVRPAK